MKRLWILGLLVLIAACAPTTSVSPLSAPERPMNIAPIQIDQVEIRLAESFPVQVFAHVRGVIGDGCSSVLPVTQQRDGNTVTLSINRQRPADAICTQIRCSMALAVPNPTGAPRLVPPESWLRELAG